VAPKTAVDGMPATEKLKTAIDSTPAAKLKTGVDSMSATEKLKTAIDRPPATKKRKTVADGTPAAKELKALTARRHTAAPIGLRLGVLLKLGKKMVEFRVKTKNNFAEVEKLRMSKMRLQRSGLLQGDLRARFCAGRGLRLVQ